MTVAENPHHIAVNGWFQRAAQGSTVESLIRAFEEAFASLWRRSYLVLGEVTLTAIVERVVHNAVEQFPFLESLEITASGLRCHALLSQPGLRHDQVSAATRFVLVEFLTVLGNLTAEILTPALHAELAKGHASAMDCDTDEDEAS